MPPRRVVPAVETRDSSETEREEAREAERRVLFDTVERLSGMLERQAAQSAQAGAGAMHDRFMRQHPPTFTGQVDAEAAEEWIFTMQTIFRAIDCTPEKKVDLATYVLRGAAANWWRSTAVVVFTGREDVSWEEFVEEFNEQYFPEHVRDRKREEFLALEQRSMTLEEYIGKFNALERYCPEIFVTQAQRSMKFVRGLRKQLRTRVLSSMPRTLADAVRSATIMERDYRENYQDERRPVGRSSGRPGGQSLGNSGKRPRIEAAGAP